MRMRASHHPSLTQGSMEVRDTHSAAGYELCETMSRQSRVVICDDAMSAGDDTGDDEHLLEEPLQLRHSYIPMSE
jgi:hypothetical protein